MTPLLKYWCATCNLVHSGPPSEIIMTQRRAIRRIYMRDFSPSKAMNGLGWITLYFRRTFYIKIDMYKVFNKFHYCGIGGTLEQLSYLSQSDHDLKIKIPFFNTGIDYILSLALVSETGMLFEGISSLVCLKKLSNCVLLFSFIIICTILLCSLFVLK